MNIYLSVITTITGVTTGVKRPQSDSNSDEATAEKQVKKCDSDDLDKPDQPSELSQAPLPLHLTSMQSSPNGGTNLSTIDNTDNIVQELPPHREEVSRCALDSEVICPEPHENPIAPVALATKEEHDSPLMQSHKTQTNDPDLSLTELMADKQYSNDPQHFWKL